MDVRHGAAAKLLVPAVHNEVLRALAGDKGARSRLRPVIRDVLAIFAEAELIEYAYLPEGESDGIAWFSVDGVEVDDDRETVVLFGEPTHVLDGPITIEAVSRDDDEVEEAMDLAGVKTRTFKNSVLSGEVGGRDGRGFAAAMLAQQDERDDVVRTEEDVATLLLGPRARKNYDMIRFVYACYLLRLEYGQKFPRLRASIMGEGLSTLLVQTYPPRNHAFHVADPSKVLFAWHTEGAPLL